MEKMANFELESGNPDSPTHLLPLRGHGQGRHRDVDLARDKVADDAGPGP